MSKSGSNILLKSPQVERIITELCDQVMSDVSDRGKTFTFANNICSSKMTCKFQVTSSICVLTHWFSPSTGYVVVTLRQLCAGIYYH